MSWKKEIKKNLRMVTPPILVDLYVNTKKGNSLAGGFRSWEEAEAKSEGYDKKSILDRAQASALAVKNGAAKFERDTVLFFEPSYSYVIATGFLLSVARNACELKILDFGGSLGSTYFNFLPLLRDLKKFNWGVIEQEHFVKFGRENLVDGNLNFFPSIEAYREKSGAPNTVLISGSLQYIRDFESVLSEVLKLAPPVIIFDRVPFLKNRSTKRKIFVQTVSEQIYPATYPCWGFKRGDVLGRFEAEYNIAVESVCNDVVHREIEYLGIVLERK